MHEDKTPLLPRFLRPFLWSYPLESLDPQRDFRRIATNILVYGNKRAIQWLFATYEEKHIRSVIEEPMPGEWDERSLALWVNVFEIKSPTESAIRKLSV